MQFRQQPQSMLWKIAFLIIALVGDVSCIRNGDGNDEWVHVYLNLCKFYCFPTPPKLSTKPMSRPLPDRQKHISAKLKNFFPSEPLIEVTANAAQSSQTSARVTNGGFRPSQMLEFTPSDVMHGGIQRYPPSYLEPNYKHQVPSSLANLNPQQTAMDKQFSFPDETRPQQQTTFHSYTSTQIPTTPVVSYLDPFTQQNYRYTPTVTPTATQATPSYIQYQREQPEEQGDQVYTVQSSLLVGNHSPQHSRPVAADEVYLKRPGYVFDESPTTLYRRPVTAPTVSTANKISYDSHDYPPPSYATQQTSNFVPQQSQQHTQTQSQRPREHHRPPYNRQDVNDNRPLAGGSSINVPQPQYTQSSNYANNFGNYLQRPTSYPAHSHSPSQSQSEYKPTHYQYEPLPQRPLSQQQRPGHNYYEYQIGEIPPQPQFSYRPGPPPGYRPPYQQPVAAAGAGAGGLATLASLLSSTQQYAPQFTNLLLGGGGGEASSSSSSSSSPLGSLLGAFAGTQSTGQHARPPNTQLIRALENIARNDDLQCVPKVLCQMIAGQTLRGQLPGFITSPAITKWVPNQSWRNCHPK